MGVGREDVGDAFACQGHFQCFEVGVDWRAGVDDGDVALAHDVDAGAEEGERAGVLRNHATDERARPVGASIGEVEIADEGNSGHVYLSPSRRSWPRMAPRL